LPAPGILTELSPRQQKLRQQTSVKGCVHAEILRAIQLRPGDSGMTLKGGASQNFDLNESPSRRDAGDSSANHGLNRDQIRRRAYEIYQERGGLPGHDLEDWLQAESEFESAALFMRAAIGEKHRP
jgi:Protein of unknown function (DUF2934)